MSKRDRKREFKSLREVVSHALNEADPLGLLAMGAPEDEYEPEVGTILPRLKAASSVAEVRTILHDEFVSWFDETLAGAPEVYDGAATKIWAYLPGESFEVGPANHPQHASRPLLRSALVTKLFSDPISSLMIELASSTPIRVHQGI